MQVIISRYEKIQEKKLDYLGIEILIHCNTKSNPQNRFGHNNHRNFFDFGMRFHIVTRKVHRDLFKISINIGSKVEINNQVLQLSFFVNSITLKGSN